MGSSSQPPLDQILRIHCVKVFVRDQELSLRFYLERLGFRLVADTVLQSGERWLAVAPPDGEAVIALIAPEPDSKQYALIGRHTDVVFVTDDVIAKYREWSSRGVKFFSVPKLRRIKSASGKPMLNGRESPVWGGVFTSFKDIDGNSFSLVSFDEVTHAIEVQRRAIAEKAEAERRVAQELEIAKRVQARLFPQHLPTLRTLDYAGRCLQALQVGGDYYDFLALGRERLGLVIGDISGKGIAAALLMANLQANLRSQCAMAIDPRALLCSVNQLFCANTADASFATLFFAEFDDTTRRLRYVNCGHLPALVMHCDDSFAHLRATATVVGAFREWDCDLQECQLAPGDTLALYTDGITESFSPAEEEFGEQRLVEALRRHRQLPSRELLEVVVNEVRQFSPHEQHDDITLIIARCLP